MNPQIIDGKGSWPPTEEKEDKPIEGEQGEGRLLEHSCSFAPIVDSRSTVNFMPRIALMVDDLPTPPGPKIWKRTCA